MRELVLAAVAAMGMAGASEAKVVQVNSLIIEDIWSDHAYKAVIYAGGWALYSNGKLLAAEGGLACSLWGGEGSYSPLENIVTTGAQCYPADYSSAFEFLSESYYTDDISRNHYFPAGSMSLSAELDAFPLYSTDAILTVVHPNFGMLDIPIDRIFISPVPLPAAAPMLLTGAALLGAVRARRRSSSGA